MEPGAAPVPAGQPSPGFHPKNHQTSQFKGTVSRVVNLQSISPFILLPPWEKALLFKGGQCHKIIPPGLFTFRQCLSHMYNYLQCSN